MSLFEVFPHLVAAWTVVGLIVLPFLFFIPAPYGRYARPGWGPLISPRLGWFLMEGPSALAMAALFLAGSRTREPMSGIFLGLWEAHYVYRAFVFPWIRRSGGRLMPLSVVLMGATFNVVNCLLNGLWLFRYAPHRELTWLADPRFVAGLALFVTGFSIHVQSDRILRGLRKGATAEYAVPRGGLFRWVSCPNYLGEMVEWIGWALATWSLAGLSFAVWTIANLLPRAVSHHHWYRSHFPDYPTDRKALVPFVF